MKRVDVIIVPYISIKSTIRLTIYVSDTAMFWDMDKYLNKYLKEKLENFRCLLLHNQTQTARFVKSSDNIYGTSRKGHLFIYEMVDDDESYPFICTIKRDKVYTSYPRLFNINPYNSVKELRAMIYSYMKYYSPNTNPKYEKLIKDYKETNYIDTTEYEDIVNKEYSENIAVPYKINLISSTNEIKSLDIFSNNSKVDKVIEVVKQGFKLVIEVDPDVEKNMNKMIKIESSGEKLTTLNDCLDHFTNYEKLDKGNEWYCDNCKKLQHTIRKIELFYIPKYFIICLKRFESKFLSKTQIQLLKSNAFVKYPVSKYNLTGYSQGPKNQQIYELYAVSQHAGSKEGGHYATACRNFGKWYEFDDISVFPSDEESIISPEGYVLFYRRNDK
jgi:hypothetical protein